MKRVQSALRFPGKDHNSDSVEGDEWKDDLGHSGQNASQLALGAEGFPSPQRERLPLSGDSFSRRVCWFMAHGSN